MVKLLILRPDNTRCYQHVGDILTFCALTIGGAKVLFVGDQNAGFTCQAADMDLMAPIKRFDAVLASGKLPHLIALISGPRTAKPEEAQRLPGVESVFSRIVAAIFANYAASANDWVRANVSTNVQQWPPISNFARVVRNAIVHGGTINIESQNAAAVSWKSISFDHSDFGRPVIGAGTLSLGDLIVLMLDLDMELDALGAPLNI